MQDELYIDATLVPEFRMRDLCESIFEMVMEQKSTKEGRKKLREEAKLYRQEQAEKKRRKPKC